MTTLDPLEDGRQEFDKWIKTVPQCVGYPECDGDLEGMEHSENCPMKTRGRVSDVKWIDVWQAAWTARAAREGELLSEVKALREYKKHVDIAWTAGMLGLSGEVGFKIQMHEFFTSLKVAFRQAEDEYMKTFGAEAALSETQPRERK